MKKKLDTKIYIILLVLTAMIASVPYFILGRNSIITYHDQLDGELLTYIINAKYLFNTTDFFPELMNGIPSGGLACPAPLFIPLYKFFNYFQAFMISMIIIKLISVIFSYFYFKKITDNNIVSFFCAVGYMLLPYRTVYGLCIHGAPMLLLSVIYLYNAKMPRTKSEIFRYISAILGIVFYSLGSSLALVGFGWIVLAFIFAVYALIRRKNVISHLLPLFTLTLVYSLENVPLIKQLLGLVKYTSHKSEVIHSYHGFVSCFLDTLLGRDPYTGANQLYYLPMIALGIVFAVLVIVSRKTSGKLYSAINTDTVKKTAKRLLAASAFCMAVAVLYGFYNSYPINSLINSSTGILHNFNFGRITWMLPIVWVSMLALSITLIINVLTNLREKNVIKRIPRRIFAGIFYIASALSVCLLIFFAVKNSDLKNNLMKLVKGSDYEMMTWNQFFAEDLYSEVDNLIGKDKSTYRVVSYGLYPSVASYNGFYCLDGYSNNYDVEYKHTFRKVIEGELNKNEYLKLWYDNWGNRCFIVTNKNMDYFIFEKKWGYYISPNDFDINIDQLKEMGCNYLISASFIIEADGKGLKLLNTDGQPILSDNSWYQLWLYELM